MPKIDLESFKNNLKDVLRPNRFFVTFQGLPNQIKISEKMSYFVKGAVLPSRVNGIIEADWFGEKLKIGGDPSIEDIDIIFYNDYKMEMLTQIDKWLDLVADQGSNTRRHLLEYKAQVKISQLGRTGETIKSFILDGAFPSERGQIDLNQESVDSFEEFTVKFSYDTLMSTSNRTNYLHTTIPYTDLEIDVEFDPERILGL